MSDCLATEPWQCGENDCSVPGGWHKGSYWYDSESGSFSYDEFSDGDHEPINESDLPAPDGEVRMWTAYRLWAVQHQHDPLGEFMYGVPPANSEHAARVRQEAEDLGIISAG